MCKGDGSEAIFGPEIQSLFTNIYGSKDSDSGQTASAVVIPKLKYTISKSTTNNLSVSTAEMIAILLAIQRVEDMNQLNMVICLDSFSVLVNFGSCFWSPACGYAEIVALLAHPDKSF